MLKPMDQQRPLDLLDKFLNGKCTPDEEQIVQEWYESIGKGRLNLADRAEEEETRKQRIYSIVQQRIRSGNDFTPFVNSRPYHKFYLAAAVIAFLVSAISLMFFLARPQEQLYELSASSSIIEHSNDTGGDIAFDLPDGSRVTLKSGGYISYPAQFDKAAREVILGGVAFFEVSRDTLSPFRVHTGEVTTQVLGTSFTIRAPENDESVEVIVRTGKVSVYRGHDFGDHPEAVVLTPNQQVSYRKKEEKLIQSVATQPVVLIPESSSFEVENVPIQDVIEKLIRLYGINIRTANNTILTCPITASFDDQNLYSRIEMICKAIGATYSMSESEIVIEGGACE
jgi:ferric-dicitrate binding protein FerR (iron transport regulator)